MWMLCTALAVVAAIMCMIYAAKMKDTLLAVIWFLFCLFCVGFLIYIIR